jgi:hypothetical protein
MGKSYTSIEQQHEKQLSCILIDQLKRSCGLEVKHLLKKHKKLLASCSNEFVSSMGLSKEANKLVPHKFKPKKVLKKKVVQKKVANPILFPPPPSEPSKLVIYEQWVSEYKMIDDSIQKIESGLLKPNTPCERNHLTICRNTIWSQLLDLCACSSSRNNL